MYGLPKTAKISKFLQVCKESGIYVCGIVIKRMPRKKSEKEITKWELRHIIPIHPPEEI
jgi:hypothetical protein